MVDLDIESEKMEDHNSKKSGLEVQSCGGRDLISAPLLISKDGKLIFAAGDNRLTVFNIETGQPVRELKTGKVLALSLTSNPAEVIVVGEVEIVTWNHELTKQITRTPFFADKEKGVGVHGVVFPANYEQSQEVYVTTKFSNQKKENQHNVYRLSLTDAENPRTIFKKVYGSSIHIGNNDGCLVVIGDQESEMGGEKNLMMCYDRHLSITHKLKINTARPLTIVRCHPKKKIVACGDITGRILIVNGFGSTERIAPAKQILHWHSCPLRSLEWSTEGEHLYSGGDERVLCKWLLKEKQPEMVPRIGSEIIGISVWKEGVAVQLASNSVKIYNKQNKPVQELLGICRNASGWPAGLHWNQRSKMLHLNGETGHVQVFNPDSKDTYSLDVARQNYLNKERNKVPLNSEVERIAISEDGMYMITVDCCWTVVSKILLKFWHFSQATQQFVLNTQVACPHENGVDDILFRPLSNSDNDQVTALIVGRDKIAKLWTLNEEESSWSCQYAFQFRNLNCHTAAWSCDGSVLAIAFNHIVALFDKTARLRTTLTFDQSDSAQVENITSLAFCRGLNQGSYLACSTPSLVRVWNLITLKSTLAKLPKTPSPITNIVSDPHTGRLAVVCKNIISIIQPETGEAFAKFFATNCTGGAVYGTYKQENVLYFLTNDGLIKMIGPSNLATNEHFNALPVLKTNNFLANRRSAVKPKEISAESRCESVADDINALLAVPLHAVPTNAAIVPTFLANRLRSIPKVKVSADNEYIKKEEDEEGEDGVQVKINRIQKLNKIFISSSRNNKVSEFDQFCKLFKPKKSK